MSLFNLFTQKYANITFFSMFLGILAGISYSLLIPIVLNGIAPNHGVLTVVETQPILFLGFEISQYPIATLFFWICVFILITRSLSQVLLTRVSMNVTSDLRIQLYKKISNTPLYDLDQIDSAKLIAALTTDVPRIIMGARMIPDILINLVTLIGMLGFLLILNEEVFWFVIGCIFFGALSYQIPMWWGQKFFQRSRIHVDRLQAAIRGLIDGAKELKLDQNKQAVFYESILLAEEYAVLQTDRRGHSIIRVAMNYGDLISFFVIGAISFVFVNYHAINNQELVGVIMALLYITTPIAVILNSIPPVAIAKTSLRSIERLSQQLPQEKPPLHPQSLPNVNVIKFQEIHFSYRSDDHQFQLGPLNFQLQAGEITFIIGGNGSGKSTLSKLITQHYLPESGNIYFDQQLLNQDNLFSARQQISAIYSDYYLFEKLLLTLTAEQEQIIEYWLQALQLSHKVKIKQGRFSTTKLSDGQRKRLALLGAILEDKPIYLFDEWAADQDPQFKAVFYQEILPSLKSKQKVIIVISHDDRYFHLADQLITMEMGKIKKVKRGSSDIHVIS